MAVAPPEAPFTAYPRGSPWDSSSGVLSNAPIALDVEWNNRGSGLALEAVAAAVIRDNLPLNILNFVHPFAGISR